MLKSKLVIKSLTILFLMIGSIACSEEEVKINEFENLSKTIRPTPGDDSDPKGDGGNSGNTGGGGGADIPCEGPGCNDGEGVGGPHDSTEPENN